MAASNDLQEALKPFYQRASEAEERLARLEAAFSTRKDTGNEELLNKVAQLQRMLEDEKEKALKEAQKASEENAKLRYRITHLTRALQKADSDLASK
ncbi:uncharacterized protein LOC111889555 isoform X2 [Lactuca sativa]|uniref:Uncharacterized protein n=1 Tax=Lactuca virosa TaxID=75947 RepID=A0AAU9LVP6_9ASTR|nr:uncharacterized protein LOC111889555 isoform X2 [Lactuca sativa]CAH1418432.1 unnamed protein product [Lactuca virosa]